MMNTKEVLGGGVAVITGAGAGIGEGIALDAVSLGMKVVLADIDQNRINRLAKEIRDAGGEALAIVTDVADPQALDRLAAETYSQYGEVRLLVNNAGVESVGFAWEISAERWEKTLNINIHGMVHGVRAFAPRMIAADKTAFIVNLASIGAVSMGALQAPYLMSKHAVLSFSECLYLDMQVKGAPIKVSAVAPGMVATRIYADAAAVESNAAAAQQRATLNGFLTEYGITGREAASMILEQVAAGQFWITTHPEMLHASAQQRAAYLSKLSTPALSEQSRALFGGN